MREPPSAPPPPRAPQGLSSGLSPRCGNVIASGAMCRLFGMSGGPGPVRATFWLLEAPDSLAQQSRREPDGTGLGYFEADGTAVVRKQPLAAYEDREFAREAKEVRSRT